jgi:hypothetical protein
LWAPPWPEDEIAFNLHQKSVRKAGSSMRKRMHTVRLCLLMIFAALAVTSCAPAATSSDKPYYEDELHRGYPGPAVTSPAFP